MQLIHTLDPLRSAVESLRNDGPHSCTVAMVPTMGALHEGHLTLVREAKSRADKVVVSIFVNPLQFGPNEDLDSYPRQLARDCALLEAEGVDLVWAPTVEAMYPAGFASKVTVTGVSDELDGAARPGHFDGVATVVCKLFNQVQPDIAFFGEKDWQQVAVIRRMARDLNLTRPSADSIFPVATVREMDGLAMSSRNAYLTPEQREAASVLPAAMRVAIAEIEAGADAGEALAHLSRTLLSAGFLSVDYAELRDATNLTLLQTRSDKQMRLLVAARIGKTRLIDNMSVASLI